MCTPSYFFLFHSIIIVPCIAIYLLHHSTRTTVVGEYLQHRSAPIDCYDILLSAYGILSMVCTLHNCIHGT